MILEASKPRRPPRSWKDYPSGFKALLSVGRTTSLQPWVDPDELVALEARYRYQPPERVKGLSVSQRLDLLATDYLRRAMKAEHSHGSKKDILTVWKARHKAMHEVPVADIESFSGLDRDHDSAVRQRVVEWDMRRPVG